MSQQALAVTLGVAVRTVARWESGGDPSALALLQLQDLAVMLEKKKRKAPGQMVTVVTLRMRVTETGLLISLDCVTKDGKHKLVEVPVNGSFRLPDVPAIP